MITKLDIWRMLARAALSLLCAGVFYVAWMAAFLLTRKLNGTIAQAIRWLSSPAITAAGFALGIAVSERFTSTRRSGFLRIYLWPLDDEDLTQGGLEIASQHGHPPRERFQGEGGYE